MSQIPGIFVMIPQKKMVSKTRRLPSLNEPKVHPDLEHMYSSGMWVMMKRMMKSVELIG